MKFDQDQITSNKYLMTTTFVFPFAALIVGGFIADITSLIISTFAHSWLPVATFQNLQLGLYIFGYFFGLFNELTCVVPSNFLTIIVGILSIQTFPILYYRIAIATTFGFPNVLFWFLFYFSSERRINVNVSYYYNHIVDFDLILRLSIISTVYALTLTTAYFGDQEDVG